jgi:hypothetical protein
MSISRFSNQLFGKLVDRFDGDVNHKIQILSGARFSPRPFCDGTPNQIFDPGSIQRFDH